MKPRVSVVVEGYNEAFNGLAPLPETVNALLKQDFPLETAELLILGSGPQIDYWKTLNPAAGTFQRVRLIPLDSQDGHYWRLKNIGGQLAEGEIVAHIDSDAVPERRWLSALVRGIERGADVSVGPSLYRTNRLHPDSAWMLAAALPSWSLMLGSRQRGKDPCAGCIMAHNVGLRRSVFLEHPFQTAKRSHSSALMFFELVRAGVKIGFEPEQRIAHAMTLRWWLGRKHFRTGWETYIARSVEPDWPRIRILENLRLIEPMLLRIGLVGRDARKWFHFCKVVGVSGERALLLFPLAVTASVAARSAEMAGMYAALFKPQLTAHQARF